MEAPSQDGLAALLLGLATWLAALGAFLVLPAIWSMPGRRWWRGPLAAFLAATGVTALAALLAVAVVHGLVGVDVANLPELLLAAGLAAARSPRSSRPSSRTSATAAGCLDCCSSWCRPRQRDCPTPSRRCRDRIAAIHPLLPLSYAVDWMHASDHRRHGHPGGVDAVVLAAWLLVGLLVTLAAVAGTRRTEVATPAPA